VIHQFFPKVFVAMLTALVCSSDATSSEISSVKHLTIGQIGHSDIQKRAGLILTKAYAAIGIELEIVGLPSKRALNYSNNGLLDGEVLRVKNIEHKYPNLVCIPIPLYQITASAYTINGNKSFNHFDELLQSPIAIHSGVFWEEELVKHHQHYVSRVSGTKKKFKLLSLGRVDYILSSQQRAHEVISEYFSTEKIIEVTPPIATINLYHYLNRNHQDLVPKIQAQLQKMTNNKLLPMPHLQAKKIQ